MASQEELDKCYMACAEAHAALSKGVRAKVGACLVTPAGIVIGGCNGLASGGCNELEDKVYMSPDVGGWLDCDVIKQQWPFEDEIARYNLVTKPEVIHAELQCCLKAAEDGLSIKGCTIYTTLSPCLPCSEMLKQIKVKRVVYRDSYRCSKGVDNLISAGIECVQLNEKEGIE